VNFASRLREFPDAEVIGIHQRPAGNSGEAWSGEFRMTGCLSAGAAALANASCKGQYGLIHDEWFLGYNLQQNTAYTPFQRA
jgi:hypothetical protein